MCPASDECLDQQHSCMDSAGAKAPFPNLDHLTLALCEQVYEPADDTFLLCDALTQEEAIRVDARIAVEVGSGSGCCISHLAMLHRAADVPQPHCIATDINPHAVLLTRQTAASNGVLVDAVRMNLADGLVERLAGLVDVLLFNPPYVPTDDEEVGGSGLSASWAGGEDGRAVIDRFLPLVKFLLSPSGRCYLVLVEENRPTELRRYFARQGLTATVVVKRQAVNEGLMIMRVGR